MVESYILAAVRDMKSYEYNDDEHDIYANYKDQLCKFMRFLREVYDDYNDNDVRDLATVCEVGVDKRRKNDDELVFYNRMNNPADRLFCVAVEWTMEHCRDYDGYPQYNGDIAYIAWFAVRAILMSGFKEVSLIQIEKQYWFNPSEFSKCFLESRGTSCWYKIKRELGRIKYVIDMWYDCNDHFNCPDGENNTLYDEYKQYYVVNKNKLWSTFLTKLRGWNEINYEKYCVKHLIDGDSPDSEEYNSDEEDLDYDGRKEYHEKKWKEECEYHEYWRKVYENPNYYSSDDDWINQ